MPIAKPCTGAQAYHLRRVLKLSWRQAADQLGYRAGVPNAIRRHSLMVLAKEYARRNGFAWPLSAREAVI